MPDSENVPGLIPGIVVCRLIFSHGCETKLLQHEKTVRLPFFPREGDEFSVSGVYPVIVTGSTYYVEDQRAVVYLATISLLHGDTWESIDEAMCNDGWTWFESDGDGVPRFDRSKKGSE